MPEPIAVVDREASQKGSRHHIWFLCHCALLGIVPTPFRLPVPCVDSGQKTKRRVLCCFTYRAADFDFYLRKDRQHAPLNFSISGAGDDCQSLSVTILNRENLVLFCFFFFCFQFEYDICVQTANGHCY